MQILTTSDGGELAIEPGARVVPREAYAEWIDAEALVSETKHRLRGWRERAASEYRRQVDRGREEGRASGERERLAAMLEFSRAAVAEVEALEAALEEAAAEAVREAFGLVPSRRRLRTLVQRLLGEVVEQQALRLSVHPEQHRLVAEILAEEAFASYQVHLKSDPDRCPDSVRVEAPTGSLETSVEAMLASLEGFRRP